MACLKELYYPLTYFRLSVHPYAKLSGSRMVWPWTRTTNATQSLLESGHPTMPRTISNLSIPLYISILTNGLVENLIGLLTMLTIRVRAGHGKCLHSKLTELQALHTSGSNVSKKKNTKINNIFISIRVIIQKVLLFVVILFFLRYYLKK